MTIHALTEYIRYRWYAKTRHGIHSPFVYDFIERVLKNKPLPDSPEGGDTEKTTPNIVIPGINHHLPNRYQKIANRIAAVYSYKNIAVVAHETEEETFSCDFVVLTAKPKIWIRLFNLYLPNLKPNSCILIANIHKTWRHTSKWNRICNHPKVKLSIDLYGMGLIFFKEDFKEKQKFVLRH